jgi:hypothetical protein
LVIRLNRNSQMKKRLPLAPEEPCQALYFLPLSGKDALTCSLKMMSWTLFRPLDSQKFIWYDSPLSLNRTYLLSPCLLSFFKTAWNSLLSYFYLPFLSWSPKQQPPYFQIH